MPVTKDHYLGKVKEHTLKEALSKICRDMGEDEDINIVFLQKDCDIIITHTTIQISDPNYLAVLVEEPFSMDLLNKIRTDFRGFLHYYQKHIKIIPNDDICYIKYPKIIRLYEIDEDIFEMLENEHDIPDSYLDDYQWEELLNSELWKKAQTQIAREIIAYKFKNEISVDPIMDAIESI